MVNRERLPDEAWVVRCGLPPFSANPLFKACGDHREGVYGFSVQAASELTVGELATECRNKSVSFTTVGEIRRMGYDVLVTAGEGRHATVVVPEEWSPEAAERLAQSFTPAKNPAPKGQS